MEDRLINFEFEELWYLFKKKFWIIIVITVIATSLAVLKVSKLQPSYSASAKVFMGNGNDMFDIYSESELSYYSQFITIFSEISKIDGFLDDTLKKHKIDNTPIVNMYYSSYTDYQMAETLDAVCEVLLDKVKEIMPTTNPTILSEAKVATIYPNKTKLPIIAFGVGIILSIGLILVLDYLDTRIISKKQLEKIVPVPVLGCIPVEEKEFRKEVKNVRNQENTKVSISGSI